MIKRFETSKEKDYHNLISFDIKLGLWHFVHCPPFRFMELVNVYVLLLVTCDLFRNFATFSGDQEITCSYGTRLSQIVLGLTRECSYKFLIFYMRMD